MSYNCIDFLRVSVDPQGTKHTITRAHDKTFYYALLYTYVSAHCCPLQNEGGLYSLQYACGVEYTCLCIICYSVGVLIWFVLLY